MSSHNKLPASYQLDHLTDLPDLAAISEHIRGLVEHMPGYFGLLALDVDGFKGVNDERGHGVGDEVLAIIGQTLNNNLRRDDRFMSARRSGDEFMITLHGIEDDASVVAVGERIRGLLTEQIQTIDTRIGISMGGRVHRADETPEDLIHAVDILMKEDKDRRKIERYNTSIAREAIRRMYDLAKHAEIDKRDIPRLLDLHERGRY
jgi:diguanylate cyclase (GGDEF)-like protein